MLVILPGISNVLLYLDLWIYLHQCHRICPLEYFPTLKNYHSQPEILSQQLSEVLGIVKKINIWYFKLLHVLLVVALEDR